MTAKFAAAATLCALIAAGQAQAASAPAQLAGLKGQVMVNRAGKMIAAAPGALRTGDRVVALAGGEAQLSYADGCQVTLRAQAMATIGEKSPCSSGAGLVSAGSASAQAAQPGVSTLQWVGIGLTVVVLGVGLAAAADDATISN